MIRFPFLLLAVAPPLLPALAAAQGSAVSKAFFEVQNFDPIPLAVADEPTSVPYPPGDPMLAFNLSGTSGTITTADPAFGDGGLPLGPHHFRILLEDSEGRTGASAWRVFRHDGTPVITAYEWTLCTSRWSMGNIPPQPACGAIARVAVDPPRPEAQASVDFNTRDLGVGTYYFYIRFFDQDGFTTEWREFVFEIEPNLPLLRAEWTLDPETPFGDGNAVAIGEPDEFGDHPLTAQVNPAILPAGKNTIYLRVQRDVPRAEGSPEPGPADGNWSEFTEIPVNRCPEVTARTPAASRRTINSKRETFSVTASDIDGDGLTYSLFADGEAVASGPLPLAYVFPAPGTYNVVLRATDGTCPTDTAWTITVTGGQGIILRGRRGFPG
ncbi:MAG: hypothetical protein RLY93_18230 [Sumerlaeia bacterium]